MTHWACETEMVEWPGMTSEESVLLSRRKRMRARGPYRATVPANISSLSVELPGSLLAEASEATASLARLDATLSAELGDAEFIPFPNVLLRTESASSSQIEQITAGTRALAEAALGMSAKPNAQLVDANVRAMQRALTSTDSISADSIIGVQKTLLQSQSPEHTGGFRTAPVWVGGSFSFPHDAHFVAPQAHRLGL